LLSEGENAEGNEKNQDERWGDDDQEKADRDGTQHPWPGVKAGVLFKGHIGLNSEVTPGGEIDRLPTVFV
jgi:hypothetical protein